MSHPSPEPFTDLAERHRRELHVHCYRMLGSFEEAEDLVQETFLRAWRHRTAGKTIPDRPALRAWLYRIATNACLDTLRRRTRRSADFRSFAELPWLQPYPDRLLNEIAPREEEPDAVVVERETIELAYIALIQRLPPRQRAVLIMREVLDWSAAETAAALDMSIPAVNSALQRARAALDAHRPAREGAPAGGDLDAAEQALLQGFIDTHHSGDAEAAIALMREDIRITMPPHPMVFQGRDAVAALARDGLTGHGDWRLVPTRANRMPTAANYLRAPGDTVWRAFKFDVLRIEGGKVAEITTFDSTLFPAFGLPPTLDHPDVEIG
jgi:RNA polymerase sigma-70 factor (ECF subfamily)